MDSCVSRWFDDLGNEIINQLVSEVDPSDPRGLELLGHDTKEKRDERMVRLKQSMKATTTDVRYGDYPWNQVSQTLETTTYLGAIIGKSSRFRITRSFFFHVHFLNPVLCTKHLMRKRY